MEIWKLLVQSLVILVVIVVAIHGTSTKLQTARDIKLQGTVSGNAKFDGSGDITINTTQANIAKVNGTISLTKGQGSSGVVAYPSNFNMNNCVVISASLSYSGAWHSGEYSNSSIIGVTLGSTGITFRCYSPEQVGPTASADFKVVLMKV